MSTSDTIRPWHDILSHRLGNASPQEMREVDEHLIYITDISLDDAEWQYDYLRFYVRPADGMVLYGTDSGCSCPEPFEITRVSDLKETTLSGVVEVATRQVGPDYRPLSEVLADVRQYIPAMREAGAK